MHSAAISLLAEAGIDGPDAETGLRQVLAELAAPSRNSREVLAALGLDAEDVDPEIHDLFDLVRRLADAGLDHGTARDLFDDEGAAVAVALTANADRLDARRRD